MTLRVAFAGTPEFAAQALEAILGADFSVPLVLTQPDRPAGRGLKLVPSAVKSLALAHELAVYQPEHLKTEEARVPLATVHADVLVVAAYGLLLPPQVLALPRLGCINIHASLLPRWRGAAPIHRAIEAGDRKTGITIMQMDAGLDTGPMLHQHAIPIDETDTTATLHDKLATLGAKAILETLSNLEVGLHAARAQPEAGVTYARKVSRAEAALDWSRPAAELARIIRAFNPFPGASTRFDDTVVKIWAAHPVSGEGVPGSVLKADDDGIMIACGEGALCVTVLQRPNAKQMSAAQFLQGFTPLPARIQDNLL